MYGLLLESIANYITRVYGADKWEEIRRKAKIDKSNFNIHQVYAETLIPRLVDSSHHILNVPREVLLNGFGESFVSFVSQFGYDQILKVLGRHLRDFLNGLDNLHEYLKFSYPKLKPPSFYCEKETAAGLILHYRSSRRYNGYMHYVSGQIKSVGRHIYKTEIQVEVLKEELVRNSVHVVFQLRFNNEGFIEAQRMQKRINDSSRNNKLQVESRLFFDVFPFHLAFDEEMTIISVGRSLETIFPNLVGYDVTHIFSVQRPKVDFGYQAILMHLNNVFEIVSIDPVVTVESGGAGGDHTKGVKDDQQVDTTDATGKTSSKHRRSSSIISDSNEEDAGQFLHLKGQMLHVISSKCFLFLATPILNDLKRMSETGLFICDMSLHDNSRELVLAGTQQSLELKLAVEQEKSKSRKLETLGQQLDKERRKNEELLFNYIPRPVIEQLRKGISAQEVCRVIDHAVVVMCQLADIDKFKSGNNSDGENNKSSAHPPGDDVGDNGYSTVAGGGGGDKADGEGKEKIVADAAGGGAGNGEDMFDAATTVMNNALAMADELAVCCQTNGRAGSYGSVYGECRCWRVGHKSSALLCVRPAANDCRSNGDCRIGFVYTYMQPQTCMMDDHCYQGLRNATSQQQQQSQHPHQASRRFHLLDPKTARSKPIEFKGGSIPAHEVCFGDSK